MSSTLRISGLASGMDIDSMVTKLMQAERMPLDKLKQKKQVLEWQRDDYRSMNTLLLDFRTQLTNLKLTTNYRARTTTSTNEAQVTAIASSAASQTSYSISNVTQLATAATLKNGGAISASPTSKMDLNKGIFDSQGSFSDQTNVWSSGSVESQTITVTQGGAEQQIKLDDPSIKLQDIASMNVKVNGKAIEVVDASTITTDNPLGANQVSVNSTGKLTFGSGITISAGNSISVDFYTDKKVQSFNPTADTNGFQLAKGSIKDVSSLTVKVSDTQTDTYTISGTNIYKGTDTTGTPVGSIDQSMGKIYFNDQIKSGQQVSIQYTQNYTAFSVSTYNADGSTTKVNFGVQGNDTLNQVISKVNSSNAGVSMFYDSFSDQMTMTRKETGNFRGAQPAGSNTVINDFNREITTSGSFINTTLKFGTGTESGGQNAIFTINGLDTQRTSNTFDMNGVTFTLKQTLTDKVTIAVNNDSDAVYNNIKGFVDKYNELIGKIKGKLSEDYYKDYPPLTDDQKQQLSETQQDQWTTKAKSGLLRNDTTLSSVLDKMRSNLYSPVTNSQVSLAYNQLASIGITTTANYLDGGKLQMDEAKLKAAIQADPTSVENLFRGSGTTGSEQGVIQRLYDTVSNAMDSLKAKAGNTFSTNKQFAIGMQLDTLNTQITNFEDRMKQVEDRYYNQFTAMEEAIQKSNSQATYLMQQFGGGQ